MAEDTYFFKHDYNARNDPKLQKLLMKQGQAGKGVYWDLIEMLYEQGGYLGLNECDTYAFELRTESERIKDIVLNFDLFKNDGKRFWSESVLSRLKTRKEKSESARKSAYQRWNNANALRSQSEGNAIRGEERKGEDIIEEPKEEKPAQNSRFQKPTVEEIKEYCQERKNGIDAQKFWDHYETRGWKPKGYTTQMKEWKAAVRTWEGRRSETSYVTQDQRHDSGPISYLKKPIKNDTI